MFNNNTTTVLYRDNQNKNIAIPYSSLNSLIKSLASLLSHGHWSFSPHLRCWNHLVSANAHFISSQQSDLMLSSVFGTSIITSRSSKGSMDVSLLKPGCTASAIHNAINPLRTSFLPSHVRQKWKREETNVDKQEKQVRKNPDIRAFFCPIKIHGQTEAVTCTNYETIEIDWQLIWIVVVLDYVMFADAIIQHRYCVFSFTMNFCSNETSH